jgi:hypothetical protein
MTDISAAHRFRALADREVRSGSPPKSSYSITQQASSTWEFIEPGLEANTRARCR